FVCFNVLLYRASRCLHSFPTRRSSDLAVLAWSIMDNTGSAAGAGMGLDGAMVQMVSHGLISGALFFCIGVMYDRVHSREISAYRSEEHTSELQSREKLVCRLLLEKKKN